MRLLTFLLNHKHMNQDILCAKDKNGMMAIDYTVAGLEADLCKELLKKHI